MCWLCPLIHAENTESSIVPTRVEEQRRPHHKPTRSRFYTRQKTRRRRGPELRPAPTTHHRSQSPARPTTPTRCTQPPNLWSQTLTQTFVHPCPPVCIPLASPHPTPAIRTLARRPASRGRRARRTPARSSIRPWCPPAPRAPLKHVVYMMRSGCFTSMGAASLHK